LSEQPLLGHFGGPKKPDFDVIPEEHLCVLHDTFAPCAVDTKHSSTTATSTSCRIIVRVTI
jgi:hypothetical protein